MASAKSDAPFGVVLRAPTLVEKVAQELSDAIVQGRLIRGTRLPAERDLGDQFGVSRTVIREAVRSLAAQGLVTVTSGRGVEVAGVDSNTVADSLRMFIKGTSTFEYDQIHELRDTIEVATARSAARRAQRDHVTNLRGICEDHGRYLSEGNLAAASEADFQFHRALASASANDLFVIVLDAVADVLHEVRARAYSTAGVGESGLRDHLAILERVAEHDEAGAGEAMTKHLAEAEALYSRRAAKET